MKETRSKLGWGALALLPIICCIGTALIATAGISVAVAAWAGGIAVGAVVLAAIVVPLSVRRRRRRSWQAPPLSVTRSLP